MPYDAAWLARQGYRLIGDKAVRQGSVPSQRPAPLPASDDCPAPSALVTLTLPYPPSLNKRLVPIPGGVCVRQAHRDYQHAVAIAVMQQRPAGVPLTGPLWIRITTHPPDRRRRDLDNVEKGLLDALAKAGVYLDDSQIQDKRTLQGTIQQPPYLQVLLGEAR